MNPLVGRLAPPAVDGAGGPGVRRILNFRKMRDNAGIGDDPVRVLHKQGLLFLRDVQQAG